MAEYDPTDLLALSPLMPEGAAVRVLLPPAGTLAHLAAQHAEGASAFARIALANGIVDPIPFYGTFPTRAARLISLEDGAAVSLPREVL